MSWGNSPRNGVGVAITSTVSFKSALPIPSLDLNFVAQGIAGALDPRITFTRASTATYTGSDGLIKTAAINTPRFDYNPTTLQPNGLLIEEQRTNLLTYSEQFDNAAWIKTNATITPNTVTAPDGASTADTLTNDAALTAHYARQSVTTLLSTIYTVSCYIKAGTSNYAAINLLASSPAENFVVAYVDLSSGTIGQTDFGNNSTLVSTSISNAGNGWYRVSITGSTSNTPFNQIRVYVASAATGLTPGSYGEVAYSGTGSTVYLWGAQLEAGSFPTSYIPTVASQVTRSADSASMTGSNFSSWYRADEGTLYGEFAIPPALSAFPSTLGAVSDGTTQNQVSMYAYTSGLYTNVKTGNVAQGDPGVLAAPVSDATAKYATALALNNTVSAWNGSVGNVDNAISLPTVNQLRLGTNGAGFGYINSHIKRLAFYPKRLSNSQLQAITK